MPTLHLLLEPRADQRCQARLPGSAAILLHRNPRLIQKSWSLYHTGKAEGFSGGFAAACRRADEMVGTDFEIL